MAAIMGETYPELYGAVGVHSGLAYGSANDVMSAFTAMRGQGGIERAAGPQRRAEAAAEADRVSRQRRHHGPPVERRADRRGPAAARRGPRGPSTRPAGETRGYTRLVAERDDGSRGLECWMIDGAEHAWSGGQPSGSYTDPRGPDASAAMVRFFLDAQARG